MIKNTKHIQTKYQKQKLDNKTEKWALRNAKLMSQSSQTNDKDYILYRIYYIGFHSNHINYETP